MKYTIDDFYPEAVVIDAGTLPGNPLALRWLSGDIPIVCCDGAANDFMLRGYPVWRIVGDCDSIAPELRALYKEILRRNPDQETNDQTKAVEYLLSKGIRRIVILGATGKREDHTLGNISLLVEYMRKGIDARIYTDYGMFMAIRDEARIHCLPGTQISIFNFGASGIKGEGLRYPLRDFDSWWQGTLNEAVADQVTIRMEGVCLIFINYPDSAKRELE